MTLEEQLEKIEAETFNASGKEDTTCISAYTVSVLCALVRQLDRIATQLEKITSLKYTEDA